MTRYNSSTVIVICWYSQTHWKLALHYLVRAGITCCGVTGVHTLQARAAWESNLNCYVKTSTLHQLTNASDSWIQTIGCPIKISTPDFYVTTAICIFLYGVINQTATHMLFRRHYFLNFVSYPTSSTSCCNYNCYLPSKIISIYLNFSIRFF